MYNSIDSFFCIKCTNCTQPPRKNANAIYGYDYHDVFNDLTSYGATYNQYKLRYCLDAK